MKKLLIMLLLCSGISIAQQGINYKAIISDDGTVIQNQQVAVSFTIIVDGKRSIYKESHILSTDTNGLIITNIGEGIPSLGNFETIDWSEQQFLKVEVDTGNGTVDMGTTAFKHVPYALHARTATTITGPLPNAGSLEKITEDNKTGYRLADANPNFYGDIGKNAVDLTTPLMESSNAGATGNHSFASGFNTIASGSSSTAMGSYGAASGQSSTAIGYEARASGNYSTALGFFTTSKSFTQTTIGLHNTDATESVGTFVSTDRLFVIGNGPDRNSNSDALIVLKNGDTEINGQLTIDAANDDTGYTLPAAKGDSGQVLAMNETNSGTHWKSAGNLAKITEGANSGYRLADADSLFYGDIGSGAVDLSKQFEFASTTKGATGNFAFASGQQTTASGITSVALGSKSIASGTASIAMGRNTEASGYASIALGNGTEASGKYSIALGRNTEASGETSIALGSFTNATGDYATALGDNTTASGDYATASGRNSMASGDYATALGSRVTASGNYSTSIGGFVTAESYAQTTFGYYNTNTSGTADSFVATDRLFVIGNGQNSSNKSDAMVVLKNGNTTINGELNVNEVHDIDSGDADMKAYIYGLITRTGNIRTASSDGFTVTKNGTGLYSIIFNNAPSSYQDYMVVGSLDWAIGFIRTQRNTSQILVKTYNTSGVLTDLDFNFVVYKK